VKYEQNLEKEAGIVNIGPGQYDPVLSLTKKNAQKVSFSISKTAKDDKISHPEYWKTL
jgi:hypothetical protein